MLQSIRIHHKDTLSNVYFLCGFNFFKFQHLFMLLLYMPPQIAGRTCSVFACVTWISYTFSIWILRLLAWVAAYLHVLHGYLTPSWLLSLWILRLLAWVAAYSHCSQRDLTPSWLLSLWIFRLLTWVAAYSHSLQRDLTPSSLLSMWIFQ